MPGTWLAADPPGGSRLAKVAASRVAGSSTGVISECGGDTGSRASVFVWGPCDSFLILRRPLVFGLRSLHTVVNGSEPAYSSPRAKNGFYHF